MKAAIVVGVLALPLVAGADEIFLHSGGRLSGVVVERRAETIVVDVGPGRVTLPSRLVDRIVEGTPAFEVFRTRSARLSPTDVRGWLELAAWARDHDLLTQSRQALEYVLAIDPGNAVANRELGHVMVGGRWMSEEEAYRARGYVHFEGTWVLPEERQAALAERAAEAQARQVEMEAAARAREAEARARTAEAEARRAEAAAAAASAPFNGIPFALAYSGYPSGYGPFVVSGYGGFTSMGGFRGRNGWIVGGTGPRTGPSCGPMVPGATTPPPASPVTTPAGSTGPAMQPQGLPPGQGSVARFGSSRTAKATY